METSKNTTSNQVKSNANTPETPGETQEPEITPALPSLRQLKNHPGKLTPSNVLSLQRTIGNQATRRLLQNRFAGKAQPIQRITALKALKPKSPNLKQETYINYTEKEFPDPKDSGKTIKVLVPDRVMDTKRTLVKTGGNPGEVSEVNVYSESLGKKDGSVSINFSIPDAPQYNYTKTVAANRMEALQKAADYNAVIGKKIDEYATDNNLMNRSGKFNNNYKWTRFTADQNKDTVRTVDPFFYDILIPYQGPTGENYVLDLLYQHAPSFTGYVEAIYDSGNAASGGLASMYDKGENTATASTDTNVRIPKYTNVHDNDSRSTRAPNILGLTSGGGASNFDAYTKIAGEGARWNAVRNHASKLQDNSYFFTQDPSNTQKVIGVNFRTLWLSWESVFGKKYGVTDAEFRNQLSAGNFTYSGSRSDVALWAWDLGEKDYDLDKSAGFKEPFLCVTAHGNMRGDSIICIKNPRKNNFYWGVQRNDLDRNWRSLFGGNYNIANNVVADAIRNDTILNGSNNRASREYSSRDLNDGDFLIS